MSINNIPIIDLSEARLGSEKALKKAALLIDKACKEIGFFILTGHGVTKDVIEQTYQGLVEFFNLEEKRKMACKLPSGFTLNKHDYTPYGYSGLLEENAYAYMGEHGKPSDYVEKFSIGKLIITQDPKLSYLTNNSDVQHIVNSTKDYFIALEELSLYLARLFAIALDLPENFFETKIQKSNDSMRLQTYPGFQNEFTNDQGMAEHTDGSLFTLLTDSSQGIQVMNKNHQWIEPNLPELDHILVNIGDLMMRWSNDQYVSTRHRVVLRNKPRQSIVFFKLANDDTMIEAFPKFCSTESPAKYSPIIYEQFSLQKMNALFGRTPEKSI